MKVVLVVTQLEGGGAQRASYRLSNELVKRGYTCANCFFYKKRENFSGLGTTKVFLDRPIQSSFDYLKICISYYKYLKREKPDVVIAFTHYANVLGLFIAYLAGIKIRIASHRNPSWGDMSDGLIKLDRLLAKQKIYTAITAVSNSTKNTFRYYPTQIYQNIRVVNNGLVFSNEVFEKQSARTIFKLPARVKLIGTIGRLSHQKNHRTLIKALAQLDGICLAIVGDGELKDDLHKLIVELNLESRVFMLGEINYDLIPTYLSSLDLYVMPSLFEGLSNALVEAMSAGVPVMTSDVESQRDVVISDDGKTYNGILVPPESVDLWVKEIKAIFSDAGRLAFFAEKAKKRSADFSVENMASGFISVIKEHSI